MMKTKQEGISIFVAMITSILVLSMALVVTNSIEKSLEQSVDVENNSQLKYATESGIEAGRFHRNARGQGVSFSTPQDIFHPKVNLTPQWTLEGRKTAIKDYIYESETVRIPFSWDGSTSPLDIPGKDTGDLNRSKVDLLNNNITVDFYRTGTYEDEQGVINNGGFIQQDFTFGKPAAPTDIPIVDWSITRVTTASGVQTFFPASSGVEPCEGQTTNVCRNTFMQGVGTVGTIIPPNFQTDTPRQSVVGDTWGEILPKIVVDECKVNSIDYTTIAGDRYPKLECFLADNNAEYVLNIRTVVPYSYHNGTSWVSVGNNFIFGVNIGSEELPMGKSVVNSSIDTGDFIYSQQKVTRDEQSLGAFDYVVVD